MCIFLLSGRNNIGFFHSYHRNYQGIFGKNVNWSLGPKNWLPDFFVGGEGITLICRDQKYEILSKNCQK